MGDTKLTFKRLEKKFLLSAEQVDALMTELEEHIEPDRFFESTVCSIYYDDDSYSLIRHSIEDPVYKEKLRVRSYNVPDRDGEVFVELKKKFKGTVYKRRVGMGAREAAEWLAGKSPAPEESQMVREIEWFLHENKPVPKVFIACDRTAYVAKDDPELRMTFDKDIRWRETELDLTLGSHGEALTEPGQVLMEIKIPGTAPLWLAHILCELELYPTGFSKYGTAYKNHILEKYIGDSIGVLQSK